MKTRVVVRLPTGWQLVELRSSEGVLFGTTWKRLRREGQRPLSFLLFLLILEPFIGRSERAILGAGMKHRLQYTNHLSVGVTVLYNNLVTSKSLISLYNIAQFTFIQLSQSFRGGRHTLQHVVAKVLKYHKLLEQLYIEIEIIEKIEKFNCNVARHFFVFIRC